MAHAKGNNSGRLERLTRYMLTYTLGDIPNSPWLG